MQTVTLCCCRDHHLSQRRSAGSCTLDTADGGQIRAGLAVGADGARSKMCDAMGLPSPNYAGYAAYRCVLDEPVLSASETQIQI